MLVCHSICLIMMVIPHLAYRCNGYPEYCKLALNQFTFPGTHSSGSGFSGPLRFCQSGSVEDGCIWQNQNRSITAQLQLGIRFLTLDTCILPDHCVNVYGGGLSESRLMACQGGMDEVPFGGYRYAGLITEVLRQINTWMNYEENRNEVIGLLFTNNSPETNKSAILKEIIRLLEQEWCPDGNGTEMCSNSGNVTLSTHYNQTNSWPTLSQVIDTNTRIFVFIEDGLNVDNLIRVWMNPALSFYTFTKQSTNTDCSSLVESVQHCNTTTELFSATGFVLGVCNDNVQQDLEYYYHTGVTYLLITCTNYLSHSQSHNRY